MQNPDFGEQPGSGASFRDPSGFLFYRDDVLYRQVNQSYREDYEKLVGSGLYQSLVERGLLIPHEEVDVEPADPEMAALVLKPEPVGFISYPYEWCFSQFKDAALHTLQIQKLALKNEMTLKDASAYNIQFHRGKPVFIDTLSLETYVEGNPWDAYRQFCQHFLAPLSLMAMKDVRHSLMMRVHLDGIPLDLASSMLPARSRLSFPLLTHIHIHASSQKRYSDKEVDVTSRRFTKTSFLGLLDSLESGVRKLEWSPEGTEWGEYYDGHNYTEGGLEHKRSLVADYLQQIKPVSVWDLGANTGRFSRIASDQGIPTVSFDVDPGAVEQNYLESKHNGENCILPLVMDLTNPSPALGWEHRERLSLLDRSPTGAVLALALVHHMAISNNVPLPRLADFFARLSQWLVIEFVPKSDSQVQRLLATRKDIFPHYTEEGFERAFSQRFHIRREEEIQDSDRRLYLMERK